MNDPVTWGAILTVLSVIGGTFLIGAVFIWILNIIANGFKH